MDPTLKKRLIGAAILIVIAAVILPMFLGGPPPGSDASETLPLDIPPAPDRDLSQVTVPIQGDAADPDRVVTVDTTTGEPVPMPTLPTVGAADPPQATPAPATGASDPVVDAAPSTVPAPASAQPSSQAPPASVADGRFWVGLGSYGQSVNADRVIAAARGRGVTVERESVATSGRELIRLRAGPYVTRAQAEQARQLLITAVPDAKPTIEESGQAPAADAPAPAAGAASPGAGAWAVQVGAFGQEINATQLSDRLKSAGFPAYVERRGESFAVRVGPYVRRTDAEARRQELKTAQKLDGLVVSHSG